jgi:RNA exonuclease 1
MYHEVTHNSPMFGLDCEMCRTTSGLEVTRVSIVNEQLKVSSSPFTAASQTFRMFSCIK